MEVEEVSSTAGRLLLLNSLKGNRYYYYKQDSHHRIEDEDDSTSAASSNTSLITMPPTTASLKTHTGHGHKKAADVAGEALGEGRRSRHHSGHRNRHTHHHHRSRHHDLSPGITTPTPVQQSSEVSLTLKAAAKMMLTTFSPFPGKMTLATIVSRCQLLSPPPLYEEASLVIVSFLTAKIGKSIPAAVQFDSLHFF